MTDKDMVHSGASAVIPGEFVARPYAGSNKRRTPDLERKIGAALRYLRVSNERTVCSVADALGVTYQAVQRLEKAKARTSLSTALAYCGALGVPVSDLLELLPETYSVGTSAASEPKSGARND